MTALVRQDFRMSRKVVQPFVSGGGSLKGNDHLTVELYEDSYNSFYDPAYLPSGQIIKSQLPFAATSVQTDCN